MKNKEKRWIKVVRVICIAIIIGSILLSVSLRFLPGRLGELFVSVSLFEKINLSSVNKIVLHVDGEEDVVINDFFLVKRVAWQSDVATNPYSKHLIGYVGQGTINLYSGDRLVRSMRFNWNGWVELYETDNTHFLYRFDLRDGIESKDRGYAQLKPQVIQKLRSIAEKAWNKET